MTSWGFPGQIWCFSRYAGRSFTGIALGQVSWGRREKDIHESDLAFLRDCAQTARFAAQRLHWHVIPCSENGVPLEREKIHQSVLSELEELL